MFYLAAILPIVYVAGYTGAYMPTQWAVLSLTLPLSLWRPAPRMVLNWLGGLFLAYAAFAAAAWQDNLYTAVLGLWYLFIWALAFRWGTTLTDLRSMWKGLAVGLSISSLVALAQHFGAAFPAIDYDTHGRAPGLLFNPVVSGLACSIVIIGCISNHLWRYTPLLFLGLALSGSRGGWLILVIIAIARLTRVWIALTLFMLGALTFSYFAGDSDHQRLIIWGIAIHGLTALGWGPDSFNDVYAIIPDAVGPQLNHLEFAHNDYLQLLFEYGLGAIPLLALLACTITRTANRNWPALFACAIAACFAFPLYHPLTAFVFCVLAGHLAADWDRVWGLRIRSRLLRLSRTHLAQRIASVDW